MTLIEVCSGSVYASTDSIDEFRRLITFLQKNVHRMETRDQKSVTIYEPMETDKTRLTDEPPNHGERDVE